MKSNPVRYAAQAVPKGVKKEFSMAGAKLMRQVLATAGTGGAIHKLAEIELLLFPQNV
jgi:hypothetical protein